MVDVGVVIVENLSTGDNGMEVMGVMVLVGFSAEMVEMGVVVEMVIVGIKVDMVMVGVVEMVMVFVGFKVEMVMVEWGW